MQKGIRKEVEKKCLHVWAIPGSLTWIVQLQEVLEKVQDTTNFERSVGGINRGTCDTAVKVPTSSNLLDFWNRSTLESAWYLKLAGF